MSSNVNRPDINLGAYGWQHSQWGENFYPDDLPEAWQLTYYSNEFNAVVVPVAYWNTHSISDCLEWIDNVHENFQFFVECHADMFASISLQDLSDSLTVLRPQLSALVFLDEKQQMTDTVKNIFVDLVNRLGLDVYSGDEIFDSYSGINRKNVWREEGQRASDFAFIENNLIDLRAVRTIVEGFMASFESDDKAPQSATIIVHHPQLQAYDLAKFRSVLAVMGY